MSNETALIAACTATPRDSLPRLVYADWLDERNDPRGEMIRVMEELRRHPVWADEYQKLRSARNRLWQSLDPTWLETLGYQKVYRPLFGTMPADRKHRWRLAEEFIDLWHGGLKDGDGSSAERLASTEERLGCVLPSALREWYQLGGERNDIWSQTDRFYPPWELMRPDTAGLHFRELKGHSGVMSWSHLRRSGLNTPDPPVFVSGSDSPVAGSISEFAVLVLLHEASFTHIQCFWARNPEGGESLPTDRYRPADIHARFREAEQVSFWEAPDRIVSLYGDDDHWFSACRTERAFQQLVRDFGERVERLPPLTSG